MNQCNVLLMLQFCQCGRSHARQNLLVSALIDVGREIRDIIDRQAVRFQLVFLH